MPRLPTNDAFANALLFETDTQVMEHLIHMIAKRIAAIYVCSEGLVVILSIGPFCNCPISRLAPGRTPADP